MKQVDERPPSLSPSCLVFSLNLSSPLSSFLEKDSFSKSKSLFDQPSFRMRLLDLCAEWTMGMRPTYPLVGHWVLKFDK